MHFYFNSTSFSFHKQNFHLTHVTIHVKDLSSALSSRAGNLCSFLQCITKCQKCIIRSLVDRDIFQALDLREKQNARSVAGSGTWQIEPSEGGTPEQPTELHSKDPHATHICFTCMYQEDTLIGVKFTSKPMSAAHGGDTWQ